jgi:Zinc-finger domain of monoamine-oxidase A repressor R1.
MQDSYSEQRRRNIEEREKLFKEYLSETIEQAQAIIANTSTPRKRTRASPIKTKENQILPKRRSARLENIPVKTYVSDNNPVDWKEKKRVSRKGHPLNSMKRNAPIKVLAPDDVTDEDIENIAKYSGRKTYSENGTTCHQCRQKTLDTKTVCRSGHCIGVRGQFCGPCLYNRYGDDVKVALKDSDWMCPPCKGICNCSICRNRQGKKPTGILTPLVKEKGYKSVSDFLLQEDKK